MPCLKIQSSNLQLSGPILQIAIGVSQPVRETLTEQQQSIPQDIQGLALIDTGARSTVIKQGIAQQLGLVPRGIVDISTPSCPSHRCQTYDVGIVFVGFHVGIPLITVIEAPLQRQNIQCLIGRDVLSKGIFIYHGFTNEFSLSF